MITLIYADTGDWVAVYRDGELLGQGHSFQESSLLGLLGIEYEARFDVDVEATGFQFPRRLTDIGPASESEDG